ncbi:MAG: glycosyltransferase family 4 protein [Asticcacaulis sp.]
MLQTNSFEVEREDFSLEDLPVPLLNRVADIIPLGAALTRAAIIGNFPPRQCGLATFTRDMYNCLAAALPKVRWNVIAMNDTGSDYAYPDHVTHKLPQEDIDAYRRLADTLNAEGTDVLFVQHEFGIYGGPSGAYLTACLERLNMPVITTLHTVLENPNADQRRVMNDLIRLSDTLITMAEKGADILRKVYNVPASQIRVVPHGAPSRPLTDTSAFKAGLHLTGMKTLTTFGLLSPNKGIETVIAALPRLREICPEVVYLVVGATHPHLLRDVGEAYRDQLKAMAKELGVENQVRFINRFISDNDLVDILQATDVYVTPYLTETQITSGTLSYALALGCPVVSTPYWHALEALSGGVGVICPFGDTEAFSKAIGRLLTHDDVRETMRKKAYDSARPSRWSAVANTYVALTETAITERKARPVRVSPQIHSLTDVQPSWTGIERMSDDCGIFQHGKYSLPDRQHGYCTDDNARALSLTALWSRKQTLSASHLRLAYNYAAFVNHAWNHESRFRNFMSYGRDWLDDGGSDDCCARALESLGHVAASGLPVDLRNWAKELINRVLPQAQTWTSLRAQASLIRTLSQGSDVIADDATCRPMIETLTHVLHEAYNTHACADHLWFEPQLSYDNARLAEGLVLGAHCLGEQGMMDKGLAAMRWIMQRQSAADPNIFVPVPTSHFCADEDGQESLYDQQPIEVQATVEACMNVAAATRDMTWRDEAIRAFGWFHGRNTRSQTLLDDAGNCHDGLTRGGVNENQGAESLLAYPLSWAAISKDVTL